MKTRSNYLYKFLGAGMAALLILPACKKQEVVTPTFDVSVPKTTYAVGEPITFNFTGTADVIQFYSGAPGAEYKFKTRKTLSGKPNVQFTTFREVPASTQQNTLSLLISKDFANMLNAEDVQKATWIDLSSRVTWSSGANNTQSGVVDLSDHYAPNTPINIAFRYKAEKDATAAQPKWTMSNLTVNNVAADGVNTQVTTQTAMGWGAISIAGAQAWGFGTGSVPLTFTGGAANTDANEDWVISLPVQLDRAQPVYGVSVKASPTAKQENYRFAGYTAAGTYRVTFEVMNSNRWDVKTETRELTITVQ